jgi:histone H3/H4
VLLVGTNHLISQFEAESSEVCFEECGSIKSQFNRLIMSTAIDNAALAVQDQPGSVPVKVETDDVQAPQKDVNKKQPRRKSRVLARTVRQKVEGRSHRQRAGRFPERECKAYQRSTENLFQKEVFKRIIAALNKSKILGVENQMTDAGKEYFLEAIQARQIYGMRFSKMLANHAKRDRVMPRDWKLFKKLSALTY